MARIFLILLVAVRVTICPVLCASGVEQRDSCCAVHSTAPVQSLKAQSHCGCCSKSDSSDSMVDESRTDATSHQQLPVDPQTPCGGECSCKIVPFKGDKPIELDVTSGVQPLVLNDIGSSLRRLAAHVNSPSLSKFIDGRELRVSFCTLVI